MNNIPGNPSSASASPGPLPMLLLSRPICSDCSCDRSCSMSLSLLSRVIWSSIRIWLSSAICCKDKDKGFLLSWYSAIQRQCKYKIMETLQSVSIYMLHLSFNQGNSGIETAYTTLKDRTISLSITVNVINVILIKRILLPAFHWFLSDIWSSFVLTSLVQISVPYAVSYFPFPSAVHRCQLHVWLDPSDSWSQPIYSQPSHGGNRSKKQTNKYRAMLQRNSLLYYLWPSTFNLTVS